MEIQTTCQICSTKFDRKLNRPLTLTKCGHTLCESCAVILKFEIKIKANITFNKYGIDRKTISIDCPFCHEKSIGDWDEPNSYFILGDAFEVNKQIMNYLNKIEKHPEQKTLCANHSCPNLWRCFNQNCKKRTAFCIKCFKDHQQCSRDLILLLNEIEQKVEIRKPSVSRESLLSNIEKFHEIVLYKTCKQIDNFFFDLSKQASALYRCYWRNLKALKSNGDVDDSFEIFKDEKTGKIIIENANYSPLLAFFDLENLLDCFFEVDDTATFLRGLKEAMQEWEDNTENYTVFDKKESEISKTIDGDFAAKSG